jgi:hypothetical protein
MPRTKRGLLLAAAVLSVAACTAMNNGSSLKEHLEAQGYSAIPLRKLSTGHESVVVSLNGREGLFVLDSGAGGSVVHSTFASSFGLQVPTGPSTSGTGAGGQITLQTYKVSSFSLSGTIIPLNEIMVTSIQPVVDALKNAAGVDIQGVIGQDLLTKFSGIIDVRGQMLYIRAEPTKADHR